MKRILICLIILVLTSCSTRSDIIKKTKSIFPLKKGDKIFVINKKDKFENLARFNYYTVDTDINRGLSNLLKEKGFKTQTLVNSNFSTESVEEARTLAALYGFDKMLFVDSNYNIKSNLNVLAVTYITLIGIYIFPGNSIYTTIDLNIELFDVKKGATLFSEKFETKSHKYLYRLGNTQSVIKSSISEANKKAILDFKACFLEGSKK